MDVAFPRRIREADGVRQRLRGGEPDRLELLATGTDLRANAASATRASPTDPAEAR